MKLRLLVGALALTACGPAAETGDPAPVLGVEPTDAEIERARQDFGEVREAFLPWFYRAHPQLASAAGVTRHDGEWPDLRRLGVQRQIDSLLHWLGELEDIPFLHLRGADRYDYGTLEYALRGRLLELEEIRNWTREPRLYTTTIATGIASLAERPAMAEEERIAALASRLRDAPALLEAARQNLTQPPELWTTLAVAHTTGLIAYLERELAAVLAGQPGAADAPLPVELEGHRDRLVAALREHREWLDTDLRDRSRGDFRMGRYLFERRLLYEEHIALDVPELNRINRGLIAEYQDALRQLAAEIDRDRTPRAILDSLAEEASPPDPLGAARTAIASLRDWVLDADVVTVPDSTLPIVRPMPPFRAETAALDGPGPLHDGPVYLSLAAPSAAGDAAGAAAALGRAELEAIAARYTFPGALVQLTHERQVESALRRLFTARSFVEGWAHYAEGMAVEEGYGDDDPVLRLVGLRRALEQHARMDAALSLHAAGLPLDDVVREFAEIALVDEAMARQEVVRATYDPLYMAAALGRLQIIELRDDYRAWLEERDEAFDLKEFHDRILDLALPLPMAREVLMPQPQTRQRPRTGRRR